MNDFLRKNIGWIVLLAIIAMLLSPYILTRPWSSINFEDTGQIGDTIGGLTAPIVGLISIVLLYLALSEQKRATDEQIVSFQRGIDYEIISGLIKEVKDDYHSLSLEITNSVDCKTYKGFNTFLLLNDVLKKDKEDNIELDIYQAIEFVTTYMFMITTINSALIKIAESSIENKVKRSLLDRLNDYIIKMKLLGELSELLNEKKLFPDTEHVNKMYRDASKQYSKLEKSYEHVRTTLDSIIDSESNI